MNKEIYWLNKDSRAFLEKGYLEPGVTPEQRIMEISEAAENRLKSMKPESGFFCDFADKFEKYMRKGWYSLSSPVWSNFGLERGLPCSCNNSHISDNMGSILNKAAEVGMMTKYGAGTSGYFGELRARGAEIASGGKSGGSIHFIGLFESITNIVAQSSVRRGSFAAYLPVEHPDIMEFLEIREEGNPIQHVSIGVCISNAWMEGMIAGDKDKRNIWRRIIQKRFEGGYPYLFFTDNVNDKIPQAYKDNGLKVNSSNLCTEILNSSTEDESFTCNLSSMNLLHYDAWKDTDAVKVLVYFMDAVIEEYIEKTAGIQFMEAPHKFAKRQRSMGIGVLGWHSLLQSKMLAFDSIEAFYMNLDIFENIQKETTIASEELADLFGEPELMKGTGLRHITLQAIAPTTSSSFILGQVSPSIEPLNSNYFVKDLAKGKFTYKNPYLKTLLADKGKDDKKTWDSIMKTGGSVQHLDFLSDDEKNVFKTFGEIRQKEIIIQAMGRQRFIDQSQSLNLMIHPKTPAKEVSDLYRFAWENGIKTLYYQRSTNPSQEYSRELLNCSACEG